MASRRYPWQGAGGLHPASTLFHPIVEGFVLELARDMGMGYPDPYLVAEIVSDVIADAEDRAADGEWPELTDYTSMVMARLSDNDLNAPAPPSPWAPAPLSGGSPSGGGPGSGGAPGPNVPGPSGVPPPLPSGPPEQVAQDMAARTAELVRRSRNQQGAERGATLQEAVNALNQGIQASEQAGAAARTAEARRARASAEEAKLLEDYRKWQAENQPIDTEAKRNEETRRLKEIGDKGTETANAQRERNRLIEEKKKADDALKEAKRQLEAELQAFEKEEARGGAPIEALSLLPGGMAGPGPIGLVAGGGLPLGQSPVGGAGAGLGAGQQKDPCCDKATLLAAMSNALALAADLAAGVMPAGVACPPCPEVEQDRKKQDAENKDNNKAKKGGGGKNNEKGKKDTESNTDEPEKQNEPDETPSPPGADPTKNKGGGGGGGGRPPPPPQLDPTKRRSGPPLPRRGPARPEPRGRQGGPGEGGAPAFHDPTKQRHRGDGPASAPPAEVPGPARATRSYGDGRFGFLHKNPPAGSTSARAHPLLDEDARELLYLATFVPPGGGVSLIERPESDWPAGYSRSEWIARARVLEQTLHERYGWTLTDYPVGDTETRIPSYHFAFRIPSVVWALADELHQSYDGPRRGPRWGYVSRPSIPGPSAPAPSGTPRPSRPQGTASQSGASGPTASGSVSEPTTDGPAPSGATVVIRPAGEGQRSSGAPDAPSKTDARVVRAQIPGQSNLGLTPAQLTAAREVMSVMVGRTRLVTQFLGLRHEHIESAFGSGIDLTGMQIPQGPTLDPSWTRELEAMVLRSMAEFPKTWTFGYESVIVATNLATVIGGFTLGSAFVVGVAGAVGAAAGATVAIMILDAIGVAAVVLMTADGLVTMYREDTLNKLTGPGTSLRERTGAFGTTLETGLSLLFASGTPGAIGRTWSRVRSLPGLLREPFPLPTAPALLDPLKPFGTHSLPRPMPSPQPFSPLRPNLSQLRPPSNNEADRLLLIESLLGRGSLTPMRTASYIQAHRIPNSELPRIARTLRPDWNKADRALLIRSGLAGNAARANLYANLAARFHSRVRFDTSRNRFRWADPDTGRMGANLTRSELRDLSLFERLSIHFSGPTRARALYQMPYETDPSRIQRFLDSISPMGRRPFKTQMRVPGNPTAPEGTPPYRFSEVPARRGNSPTRGVLQGKGFEMRTVLGSSRSSVTDFLPPGWESIVMEGIGMIGRGRLTAARATTTHAEMQAVGLMRHLGIKEAWLDINYIGGPCNFCWWIRTVLPRGSTLHVRYLGGDGHIHTQTFQGEWYGVVD